MQNKLYIETVHTITAQQAGPCEKVYNGMDNAFSNLSEIWSN